MDGELIDLENGLVLFLNNISLKAVMFIGGLGDGFFAIKYVQNLYKNLKEKNISFAQIFLRSMGGNHGRYLLKDDCQDLLRGLRCLIDNGMNEIYLMGHSTGCQDILYLLNDNKNKSILDLIKGIILQGPVSDREFFNHTHPCFDFEQISENAGLFLFEGILFKRERFMSLYSEKGGEEDMFSSDLEAFPAMSNVRIRTMVLYSNEDEYVPPNVDKNTLLRRWEECNQLVKCHLLPGSHSPEQVIFEKLYWPLITSFVIQVNLQ